MLVQHLLEASAERLPDKACLICDGQRLTYREVDARANRLAHALLRAGFRRGERAVIFLPNSVEAVVAIFAVLKAGGVFVVANVSTKEAKLAYILENSGARALIMAARNASLAARLRAASPSLATVVLTGARRDAQQHAVVGRRSGGVSGRAPVLRKH